MDIAIIVDRTSTADNSGITGVDVGLSVEGAVAAGVEVGESVGEEAVGVIEGFSVGSELGDTKFANVLKACFGFPLLS
jgi:hypothetical protein